MYLSSHLSQLLVKRSKKSSISVGRVNEKSPVQAIQIFDLCEIPFANAIVSTDNKPDIQVSAHSRMWHFMNFHQAPWRINSSIVSLVSCPNFVRNLVSFSLFDHSLVPDRRCKKTLLWVSHLDNYQNEKTNTKSCISLALSCHVIFNICFLLYDSYNFMISLLGG